VADIVISKKDEVYLKVSCDPSLAQELHDHFSFDVPGAKFHPLYRSKVWDGKLRLYSMFTKELYVGLKAYLEHFAEVNQYTVDDSTYVQTADVAPIETVRSFIDSLQLASKGKRLEVRDYQVEAIHKAINDGRRLLLSPTGSGKSLIIYTLIRWHEQFGRKQLIIVPTTSLVEQLYSDFQDYSSINGWKASYNCYRIYGTVEKTTDMPITISTWQSLYKLGKPFFKDYKVIYGDECHLFKAKSLTGIMHKCVNTPYRVGTTGTLDGTKTHKLVLEGLFGPVYKTTTTKELIDNNQLANLKIFAVILQYDEQIKKTNKDLKYQEEMDFLVQHEPRNKFIRNLALDQKGNTLVLFQFVEKHGKILHDMMKVKAAMQDRKLFFIYGGTDTQQREEARRITEDEEDAIIIASFGTFSTGINIRNLHNIIFASPSKSRIRNLQSIGRGLRIGDKKSQCKLYDIGDDMTWKTRKNYTLYHMMERIKIYADEEFDYSIAKVNI
jgi:superfamily II DNA or RNA helicase